MAVCGKAHAIKAVLLAGLLIVTFNLLSNHLDNRFRETFNFSRSSSEWPITRSKLHSSLISNISTHNVYTVLYNSDNNTLENVRFNVPYSNRRNNNNNNDNNLNHSNSILLVDSTDFKRKFSNSDNNSRRNNRIYRNYYKNNKNYNFNKLVIESNQISSNNSINGKNESHNNLSAIGINEEKYKNGDIIDGEDNDNDDNNYETSSAGKLLKAFMNKIGIKKPCPLVPPILEGPIEINTTMEPLEDIEQRLSVHLQPGGWYKPKECNARDHVAIIVPFRDRYAHLPIFLKNIHPILMKQQIQYGIYLIEQTNGKPFNRAALMNIGYLEALKQYKWDCFIFHDIDLLPLDDRNLYTCPDQPRHMSVAIDIFGYKLPYTSIFGGVSAMTTSQFQKVNGFSNSFWGWGGEDDDMSNRLKHANFHISRYPINVARYMMLNHQKEKANPKRFENLVNGAKKFETDGLNSVKYDIYSFKKFPLFTWFLVELKLTEHR